MCIFIFFLIYIYTCRYSMYSYLLFVHRCHWKFFHLKLRTCHKYVYNKINNDNYTNALSHINACILLVYAIQSIRFISHKEKWRGLKYYFFIADLSVLVISFDITNASYRFVSVAYTLIYFILMHVCHVWICQIGLGPGSNRTYVCNFNRFADNNNNYKRCILSSMFVWVSARYQSARDTHKYTYVYVIFYQINSGCPVYCHLREHFVWNLIIRARIKMPLSSLWFPSVYHEPISGALAGT